MNIEKYLLLNKYILSLFGVEDFRELKEHLQNVPEGTESDGKTFFLHSILSHFKIQDPSLEEALHRYDENIQTYQKLISYRRKPVSLKYFQYLAVLFSEIFLDNLKNEKQLFLRKLNEFHQKYTQNQGIQIPPFEEKDLYKIAYWMATGSGKTLIMHINYYQFQKYKLFQPDNILLITPNEGLSRQHYEELEKSGIPARLYSEGFRGGRENQVLVIEMTKFVEEKKGGGVTLPVETFEGRNLVFVDEGHKGKRSEERRWAKLRNRLAEEGFVFEYSATFGQILEERNWEVLEEYAKSILYDYSYKYFYSDRYGKDFSVLNINIRDEPRLSESDFQETMFVANLLSFYQQLLTFDQNKELAREHNLEKPLWIFVGTTVTGKEEESDVIQIVDLLRKTLSEEDWLREKAGKILNGEYKDKEEVDIFKDKFPYLKDGLDWIDLYRRVFGGKGRLGVYELKNAMGEVGLKAGEGDYFGVVNIGDVSSFKKQLALKGIPTNQDLISPSLFDRIKRDDSPINMLIGSKKFIEGWDTWRVSSMGLLNIGKGQGPQIIQLFGRGVRLKGKGMSLKRSEDSKESKILETLNIYSIRADYLERFLSSLNNEMDYETIPIPVEFRHKEKWEELLVPAPDERRDFSKEEPISLEIDDKIYFTLDLLPKLYRFESEERREGEVTTIQAEPQVFPIDKLELLNWGRIYSEICQFKEERGYNNLVFNEECLKGVLQSDKYKLRVSRDLSEVKDEEGLARLEDIALLILKKYIETYYNRRRKEFETAHLKPYSLKAKQLPLFAFEQWENEYVYKVHTSDKELVEKVEKMKKIANKLKEWLRKEEKYILPRLYIDNHLFFPLLIQKGGKGRIKHIHPQGLVESEVMFLEGVRDFLKKQGERFKDREVFILRNFPQSGIGFQLDWARFFPDFIVWVKGKDEQVIAFVDPKGLMMTKGLNDEKVKFATEGIKGIEKSLGRDDIRLECFILSLTGYEELVRGEAKPKPKEVYEENNILFLKDSLWTEKFFKRIL